MRTLLSIALLTFVCTISYAQKITEGTWYNAEKTARVQFYEQNGKLFGKIVWLKEPVRNGQERTDENNPNKELAKKPLMGLVFLKGFEKDGENAWDGGTIYDPKNGKTYSSNMKLVNPNKLDVRGYIGVSIIGRTSVFIRATK